MPNEGAKYYVNYQQHQHRLEIIRLLEYRRHVGITVLCFISWIFFEDEAVIIQKCLLPNALSSFAALFFAVFIVPGLRFRIRLFFYGFLEYCYSCPFMWVSLNIRSWV
jgi:hypothetical protein